MKQRIEEIFKNSFYEIIDNPNLLSIFVIGSMAKDNYIEKKSNDYDIRFILKEMNVDDYQELLLFLDKRKKEIEELGYGCEVSDIIGPVKMENVKDKNILLHSIIMTEEDLDRLPNIHKYSYSTSYKHLYGKDLVSKYKQLTIKPNDVIYSDEGIEFCIKLLSDLKTSYMKWCIQNDELVLKREYVELDNNSTLELFNYSYKKAVDNIINMAITSSLIFKDFNINYTEKEKELINKINTNNLDEEDVKNNDLLISILYKLEKFCLELYNENNKKKFYNSLEWGIVNKETNNIRGNGFKFLKEMHVQVGNNFSLSYSNYINNKEEIDNTIKDSNYIVLFEPPNSTYKRYGVSDVKSIEKIDKYIVENKLELDNYNVSFIEQIEKCNDSFVGVAMSDGTGNLVIEIMDGTCDCRELTSRGGNPELIKYYSFNGFEDGHSLRPGRVKEIKDLCQYFAGYYEFAYGKIRGNEDVYFTFYSADKEYINIFRGGKQKCKIIEK